ncbi:MAG: cadherin repeat domain-containing protein, partial [Ekhidna sp.]|nr:cadherin repeat domain-containing protein [Ekhidna sp.]
AFVINDSSGLLTVVKALDLEATMTYMLKVSISNETGSNAADITINVTDVEESPPPGTRLPDKEFDLTMENDAPTVFWSDGVTIWVGQDSGFTDPSTSDNDKLYAYTLDTGTRDTAKEFDLAEENEFPVSLWSDGTTLWVLDADYDIDLDEYGDAKIYAYQLK